MFTADTLIAWCETQLGVKKDIYSALFGRAAVESYCCAFGSAAFKQAGHDIGYWASCSELEAKSGIQYGMLAAGFKKLSDFSTLQKGDALIINHHNDNVLIYDHFCFCLGEYRTNKGVCEVKTIGGNPNSVLWFPVSHVECAWRPTYASDGWSRTNGYWQYFEDGKPVTDAWRQGEDLYRGKWFHLGKDGRVEANVWREGQGKYAGIWYYLGKSGYPVFAGKKL